MRREIVRLAHCGLDVRAFSLRAARALRRAVPFDGLCVLVLDPATSWPWSSDDKRIAALGVMGDAREASVEHGNAIVGRVVAAAEAVLRQLRENSSNGR